MKPPADATPLYRLSWMALRGLLNTFHRWEVYGAENIPMSGPFILAGNHASFYDPPVFGVGCPRALTYFARSTLFKGTVGKIIRAHNAVPVDRDSGDLAAFRTVFGILKQGGGLLVFPEGTRTSDGELQPAKPGLGMIAARTGAPIVPARIHGSFAIFSRHMKMPDLDNRLIVCYGPPLYMEDVDPGKGDPDRFLKISQAAIDAIAKLNPPPPPAT